MKKNNLTKKISSFSQALPCSYKNEIRKAILNNLDFIITQYSIELSKTIPSTKK
jgi:hypothetical protein